MCGWKGPVNAVVSGAAVLVRVSVSGIASVATPVSQHTLMTKSQACAVTETQRHALYPECISKYTGSTVSAPQGSVSGHSNAGGGEGLLIKIRIYQGVSELIA